MKRVLWAIILCLLMSSIANAECAWVLWEKKVSCQLSVKWVPGDWSINSAYPNYEMCIEKRNSILNSNKETWKNRQIFFFMMALQ
jgi:hypothetical protein